MHRKTFRCTSAAIVAILLWSLGGAARVTNSDEQEEITRLAQLTQWKVGTVVADIGAGDGSYSFAAVETVGPSGRVYATEIDPDKLKNLKAEAAKRKLQNVIVVEGAADDTKLPSNCCDTIFLRHVYHHITQPREPISPSSISRPTPITRPWKASPRIAAATESRKK
jgi:SAM-dependent methyltransferase